MSEIKSNRSGYLTTLSFPYELNAEASNERKVIRTDKVNESNG